MKIRSRRPGRRSTGSRTPRWPRWPRWLWRSRRRSPTPRACQIVPDLRKFANIWRARCCIEADFASSAAFFKLYEICALLHRSIPSCKFFKLQTLNQIPTLFNNACVAELIVDISEKKQLILPYRAERNSMNNIA